MKAYNNVHSDPFGRRRRRKRKRRKRTMLTPNAPSGMITKLILARFAVEVVTNGWTDGRTD